MATIGGRNVYLDVEVRVGNRIEHGVPVLNMTRSRHTPLRTRLITDPPEQASLPWQCIHDPCVRIQLQTQERQPPHVVKVEADAESFIPSELTTPLFLPMVSR